MRQYFQTTIVAALLIFSIQICVGEENSAMEPIHPKQMVFLGTFNGTSYLADTTKVDWKSANDTCQRARLKLAQFNSKDHADFIVNILLNDEELKGNKFWIGLIENRSPYEMLKWAENWDPTWLYEKIDRQVIPSGMYNNGDWENVYYGIFYNIGYAPTVQTKYCSEADYYSLCQSHI